MGNSVSLSNDGNTALVGGYKDDGGIGAGWIYIRDGENWVQEVKLVGKDIAGNYPSLVNQGISVSLSGDGNTAIIGGSGDNSFIGAAWIFTRMERLWIEESKLIGSGNIGVSGQGIGVALNYDGNKAIVGGYSNNFNTGAIWEYQKTGGIWTQQGSKLIGSGNTFSSNQNISVSLSSDGKTAISGGYYDKRY